MEWVGKEKFAGDGKPPPDSLVIQEKLMTVRIEVGTLLAFPYFTIIYTVFI